MEGHIDHNLVLSDAQALLLTGADSVSDNQVRIPVDSTTKKLGPGRPLYVNVMVETTCAGGTNLAVAVRDAADDGADAPDTFAATAIKSQTRTVASNQLDAHQKLLSVALPPETREWVDVQYDVTGSMTAGKLDAWISDHPLTSVDG